MKTCLKLTICFTLFLLAGRTAFSAENAAKPGPDQGPLHTYVKQADDSYKWVKRAEGTVGKATWVELILTSQHWKDTVWKHQLFVIKPGEVETAGQAILLIDGGGWKDELENPPTGDKPGKLPQEAAVLVQVAERGEVPRGGAEASAESTDLRRADRRRRDLLHLRTIPQHAMPPGRCCCRW